MGKRLPVQFNHFIGRQREMGDITRLLASARLVTLTGPGGCGKTRLAAVVAAQMQDAYDAGAAWVDLASISDESLVSQAVAKALKVKEQPDRSMVKTLVDFLGDKNLLLVLDNCEHLIAACAQLVNSLLSACPALDALTTSREPLALAGENIYPVPALSLPSAPLTTGSRSLTPSTADVLDDLSRTEAVALFLDRAAAIVPGFGLTPENAAAIADICIRLDGMPLAIELAAARVNVLTAAQIAQRLDNRFTLLKSDQRGQIDRRHQTLRAAIDWSYDLLKPHEQRVLRSLSVFAGGCSLATVETVGAESIEQEQLIQVLSSLVRKSWLSAETVQRSEARYTLLETIRQYGQEKLTEAGEWRLTRDRHLRCFCDLAQETDPKIRGEYQQLWLNWLESENDNMRLALSWSLESGQIEMGLRTAIALFQFWTIRDYVQEGLTWLQRLLDQPAANVPPYVRSEALANAATLAGRSRLLELEQKYADEAAILGEAAGEDGRRALAWARGTQAWVAHKKGNSDKALSLGLEAVQLWRALDDDYNSGISLSLFSFLAMSLDKYDQAQTMLDEALPLLRHSGDTYRLAMALNYLGDLARCRGDHAQAIPAYEESLSLLGEIDAVRDQASVFHNLGHAFLRLGDEGQARELFGKSLVIHQEQGNEIGAIECLIGFAALAIVDGQPASGARLLSAVSTLGGRPVTSEWPATRLEYQHYVDRARAGLTETAYLSEQAAGQRLSVEQALALAKEVARRSLIAQRTGQQQDQLTPRELDVASLISQGKSNEQIAAELVVSKRTVEKHIAHIRSKLGLNERVQIVLWGIDAGLAKANDNGVDS